MAFKKIYNLLGKYLENAKSKSAASWQSQSQFSVKKNSSSDGFRDAVFVTE